MGSGGTQRPAYPSQILPLTASQSNVLQQQHPHHYPLTQHGQQQKQPQQINRPPLPASISADSNQNVPSHLQPAQHSIAGAGLPNSRASSSSGGNASTVQSTGGGSIGGGAQSGPSPNGSKQEQRLTHEQVILYDTKMCIFINLIMNLLLFSSELPYKW